MEDNINTKNKEERDWEKTGIKVLDMAKQELFLGMRYMFLGCAVCGSHPTITELIDYEQVECTDK